MHLGAVHTGLELGASVTQSCFSVNASRGWISLPEITDEVKMIVILLG
jgi:hypothetical protein